MAIEPQRRSNPSCWQSSVSTVQVQTGEEAYKHIIKRGLIFPHYKNGLSLHQVIRICPQTELIKEFISLLKEKEIDAFDSSDQTAVMVAAKCMNIEALNILFAGGADFNLSNKFQQTPLYQTIFESISDINPPLDSSIFNIKRTIECLLQHGANIDVPDRYKRTALQMYLFSTNCDSRLIYYLVAQGAEPPSTKKIHREHGTNAAILLAFIQAGINVRKRKVEEVLTPQFSEPQLLALINAYI